jgi:hypothetical protein
MVEALRSIGGRLDSSFCSAAAKTSQNTREIVVDSEI